MGHGWRFALRRPVSCPHLAATVDPIEAAVLRRLADGEDAHADYWEQVPDKLGVTHDQDRVRLAMRGRLALALGRRFGLIGAMPVLERHEGPEIEEYSEDPHA